MESNTIFSGFKIKGLRIKNGYNLADMARLLEITTPYLSQIENGKRTPSKKILLKAASIFNVSLHSFYESPTFLGDLMAIASKADLSDLIQAFEIILSENKMD